jgi:hypothetical protein
MTTSYRTICRRIGHCSIPASRAGLTPFSVVKNTADMRLRFLIVTFMVFQFFATRAAALPTVVLTGQYTDRYRPTLTNTVIPPGDNLQIYAAINTTDPPGSPTIAVTAKQGDRIVPLNHFPSPFTPDNFYWSFIDFDPNLTGVWEIIPTDSTGTGPSAFADALAEPELLPYVETITPQGSPRGTSVEWTLPDLTGFDVDEVHVRIVQVTPRSEVFSSDSLPIDTTSFEPPSGIFQYGVEYVYNISLINSENRSGVQSQPFRFVLPGDFNADGTVDAADYVVWRKGLGATYTQDDYGAWRAHFGASLSPGSGATLPSAEPLSAAVPESASLLTLLSAVLLILTRRCRIQLAFGAGNLCNRC